MQDVNKLVTGFRSQEDGDFLVLHKFEQILPKIHEHFLEILQFFAQD